MHNLHFIIEGDVEVVMDVPLTEDKESLEQALTVIMHGEKRRDLLASPKRGLRSKVKMQRVVLGRRGPGSVLGDDSLRVGLGCAGVWGCSMRVWGVSGCGVLACGCGMWGVPGCGV